jgi:hypothetical protein
MFSFIHSADLHLGKAFARFPGELGPLLREARMDALPRLAQAARERDAGLVVLAGDIWDSAEPERPTVARALDAMAEAHDLTWALLPGNHDPATPGGFWDRLTANAPANVVALLDDRAPVEIAPGVCALAAPRRVRRAGRDLTAWMDAAPTPEGALRLGVAHGPVIGFDEDGDADVIDRERGAKAGLDYLALGDWHGATPAGPRAWYSGTPEPAGFKDNGQGHALAVTLPAPGAAPLVTRIDTAHYRWAQVEIALAPGSDGAGRARAAAPDWPLRRTLLDLRFTGEVSLADRAALERGLDAFEPALALLRRDLSRLGVRRAADDLDAIAVGGALRAAAEALFAAAEAEGPEAEVAREALDLLYSWRADEAGGGA